MEGVVVTDLAGGLDHATSVDIEPSGRIVVAGLVGPAGAADFGLARYNVDGSLDSSFGTGGKTTTSFTAGDDLPVDVAIQRDGRWCWLGTRVTTSPLATSLLPATS
jgi:Domain of unknown function (DUF5122) beta-propeller